MSQKRSKIERRLLLITNGKSHTRIHLVPGLSVVCSDATYCHITLALVVVIIIIIIITRNTFCGTRHLFHAELYLLRLTQLVKILQPLLVPQS